MYSRYLSIFKQVIVRAENYAASNPPQYPNNPRHMNAIVEIITSHPEWLPYDILLWYKKKYGEKIRIHIGRFFTNYHLFNEELRKDFVNNANIHYMNIKLLLFGGTKEATKAYIEIRNDQQNFRRSWPAIARVLWLRIADDFVSSNDKEIIEIGNRMDKLANQLEMALIKYHFDQIIKKIAFAREIVTNETFSEKLSDMFEQVKEVEAIDEGIDDNDV